MSVHEKDDPTSGYGGTYIMGARGSIKKYIKTFEDYILKTTKSGRLLDDIKPEMKHIVNTLIYNRILIHIDTEKRENVLEQLLDG